jgi:hypothetical protein
MIFPMKTSIYSCVPHDFPMISQLAMASVRPRRHLRRMAPRQEGLLLRRLAALLRRGERRQVLLRLALPGQVQLMGLPW